jgi:AP-2 complex subunit mu-1
MISGLFFVNQKGEVLISRFYRDDVSRQAVDAFRLEVIVAKNVGVPVVHLDNSSFMYTRQGDVYIVAVTKSNSNCTLVFQFLYKLVEVFKAYFGGAFEENSVRENFVLIYELLDETMDHGYPQITAVNLLTAYIKIGNVQDVKITAGTDQITSEITGAVDWRQPNKYKYRKNEVFLDVLEAVNLLMSNKGSVLKSDVSGKIIMKTYLTGMPECKFGLNDKLVMEKEAKNNANKKRHGSGIAIDDITFHRCVRLGQFDQDRTISFIPPDGEFELMKYRITQNVNLPFKVIPVINEYGTTRVEYEVRLCLHVWSSVLPWCS